MSQTEPETTEKTTEKVTGQLIPQPHGGALRHGGTNRGGPGVPKSTIRLEAQETFRELLKRIKSRMGKEQGKGGYSPNEEIKAAELMLKAGMGEVKDVSLDKEQFMTLMADEIGSWCLLNQVEATKASQLIDRIETRLRDV